MHTRRYFWWILFSRRFPRTFFTFSSTIPVSSSPCPMKLKMLPLPWHHKPLLLAWAA